MTHLRAAGALAFALFLGGSVRAGEEAAPPPEPVPAAETAPAADAGQPALDLSQLGALFGGQPGEAPAWQKKLDDMAPLVAATDEALRAGDEKVARENLAKIDETLADPALPARGIAQFVFHTGFMYQQLGDHEKAAAAYWRIIALADADGMEVFGREALKGVALAQLADMAAMDLGRPEEALAHFDEAAKLENLPAELRSTIAGRAFFVRMSFEKLFDKAALAELARRQVVWSVYMPQSRAPADPRLPGALATVAALEGRADEARALLALLEKERGVDDDLAPEMALPVAYAYATLGDADGAARWLDKELEGKAFFQAPREFVRTLDWLAKAHALRGVADADAVKTVFAEYRAKADRAAAEKRATVVTPPEPEGGFPMSFGG